MNLKNSGDSTGFEPMTSAMPVQCSHQLSYEVTQIRKTNKSHPLDVAKKYVETYSSSNAAAQDPEEGVRLINIEQLHYKINSLIQKLQKKKKNERTRRLTDLERPKSPAQSLHIPSTSHNNPRTSQSCRQNNNFRLIYSNVRNYSKYHPTSRTEKAVIKLANAR